MIYLVRSLRIADPADEKPDEMMISSSLNNILSDLNIRKER
jgi:hypothetical protein